ncbi:C40 family peptidase [Kurthia massiliensis]|uniref:C40 family peptidase n=1 Tax=Kurthia massiliensis TaxID=1033739 RepID=UPI00028A20AD|nr:C40 family peptidase [Kurthia massiliensis]
MRKELTSTLVAATAFTFLITDVEAQAASTYKVKKGDSLASIARAHHTSSTKLRKLNDLAGNYIYVGQSLKVPGKAKTTSKKKTSKETTTYTVKSGDSLGLIALKSGISIATLKSLNDLKNDTIFVGQSLNVTTTTKTATASYTAKKPTTTKKETAKTTTSNQNQARHITSLALKYQGVPYVWGGASPSGFDCSGFIYYIFKQNNYSISRMQVSEYRHIATTVSAKNLVAGDLIFFQNTYKQGISHAGIYLGGGQFVHAGTSSGVTVTSIYDSYWSKHFHSYGRLSR